MYLHSRLNRFTCTRVRIGSTGAHIAADQQGGGVEPDQAGREEGQTALRGQRVPVPRLPVELRRAATGTFR